MSNRTEMVARLRQELGDPTAPYIWEDAHLHNLIVEAAEWYSGLFPMKTVAYDDVSEGQRVFSVPQAGTVIDVELPPGVVLPRDPQAYVGDPTVQGPLYRQAWAVWDGDLYLRNPAGGDEVGIAKLAMHAHVPWGRPDPIEQWNGPFADEVLLIVYAAWQAWLAHDGTTQRLKRSVPATTQAGAYRARLEDLLKSRRRRFGSRLLEVQG